MLLVMSTLDTSSTNPQTRAATAAQDLLRAVNEMSFDTDTFAANLAAGHRTLQQGLTAALLTTVIRMAENYAEGGFFDLRNEASARVCEEIRQLLLKLERETQDDGRTPKYPFCVIDGVVHFPFI